jgi:uncharacterized membrane protein
VTRSLVRIGTAGAVVLLVGLVLIGSGFAIVAEVEQSEVNCAFGPTNQNCQHTVENGQNTTIGAEYMVAAGAMASGVGAFLVVFAMISIMALRAAAASAPSRNSGGIGPVQLPTTEIPLPVEPAAPSPPSGPGG